MESLHQVVVKAKLADLLPTQVTVGYAEVRQKRDEWTNLSKKQRQALLDQHWFPSVLGPKGRYYVLDHHHLGMALIEEQQKSVHLTVQKDLSWLDLDTFWRVMEFHQWAHPFDESGKRVEFRRFPKTISGLKNDDYRSLAGLARRAGAFAKEVTPFSEFLWSDYFRPRIDQRQIQKSMDAALVLACELAKRPEARYLPGWVGKS